MLWLALERVTYQVDFGAGEGFKIFKGSSALFKYARSGNYTVKAQALLDGQVQREQALEVEVTPGSACTYVVLLSKEPASRSRSESLEARVGHILRASGGTRLYTFSRVFQGYAAQLEPEEVSATGQTSGVESECASQPAQQQLRPANPAQWLETSSGTRSGVRRPMHSSNLSSNGFETVCAVQVLQGA